MFFKQFCFYFSWFLHFIVLFAVKRSNTIKRVAYIKILTIFIVVLGATAKFDPNHKNIKNLNTKIIERQYSFKIMYQNIQIEKEIEECSPKHLFN